MMARVGRRPFADPPPAPGLTLHAPLQAVVNLCICSRLSQPSMLAQGWDCAASRTAIFFSLLSRRDHPRRTHVLSLALALCLGGAVALAADDEEATPAAKSFPVKEVNRVGAFVAAPLDLTTIAAEDRVREQLGLPPRFAIPQEVSMSPRTHGTWERLPGGKLLWRLRIIGREGASNLNLGFSRFKLPAHARILVYSSQRHNQLRAFTDADNEDHGQRWTPVRSTDDLVVELTVPRNERTLVDLELNWVNQGYRGF